MPQEAFMKVGKMIEFSAFSCDFHDLWSPLCFAYAQRSEMGRRREILGESEREVYIFGESARARKRDSERERAHTHTRAHTSRHTRGRDRESEMLIEIKRRLPTAGAGF